METEYQARITGHGSDVEISDENPRALAMVIAQELLRKMPHESEDYAEVIVHVELEVA